MLEYLTDFFRVIIILWTIAIVVIGIHCMVKLAIQFINSKRKMGIDSTGELHYMRNKDLKEYRRTHKNIFSRTV